VISLISGCLVDVVFVMSNVFILVYNFHVPLALKAGCPSSGVSCDIALAFIFPCVGPMAIFYVFVALTFTFGRVPLLSSLSCF
jgi:hypothetical protein